MGMTTAYRTEMNLYKRDDETMHYSMIALSWRLNLPILIGQSYHETREAEVKQAQFSSQIFKFCRFSPVYLPTGYDRINVCKQRTNAQFGNFIGLDLLSTVSHRLGQTIINTWTLFHLLHLWLSKALLLDYQRILLIR